MKRLIAVMFTSAILLTSASAVSQDPEQTGTSQLSANSTSTAYPATMTVKLNGKKVKPVGYNINGNNYYKLRDIAQILDDTTAQFNVSWDNKTRAMNLTPKNSYQPVGGELGELPTKNATAQASNQAVTVNGESVRLSAYNINGNNYFKLVDLGQTLDFEVDYEAKSRTVLMTTSEKEEPSEKPIESEKEEPFEKPIEPEKPTKPEPPQQPEIPAQPILSPVDGKLKIWIDPGHGGSDSGNTATSTIPFDDYWGQHHDGNTKIYEKDFNLAVSLMLQQKLESSGVEVRMTRSNDSTVTPSQRQTLFRTEGGGYDMIFSVHHNGYSNSTPKGAELLIQIAYENGGPGKEFGNILKEEYTNLGQSWRRFVFQHSGSDPSKDYYFVLRSAQEGGTLAFISEFCFMSNPDDQLWLMYPENLEKQAQAQYNAIMKYFETHPY